MRTEDQYFLIIWGSIFTVGSVLRIIYPISRRVRVLCRRSTSSNSSSKDGGLLEEPTGVASAMPQEKPVLVPPAPEHSRRQNASLPVLFVPSDSDKPILGRINRSSNCLCVHLPAIHGPTTFLSIQHQPISVA